MKDFFHLWSNEGGVAPEFVDLINNVASTITPTKPYLGFDGDRDTSSVRSSDIRWLYYLEHPNIVNMFWHYANMANKLTFGFDLNLIDELQHTTYYAEENGHYEWHTDTFWANPSVSDRKITLIVHLSEPDDYEGGDLLLDPQYPQIDQKIFKQKGSVVAFPSFLRHKVTTVTRGTRKTLVTWAYGPKFR